MGIEWQDVGERALKTAVQAAILALIGAAKAGQIDIDVSDGIQRAEVTVLWGLGGAVAGAAVSAAMNIVEDAVRSWRAATEAAE